MLVESLKSELYKEEEIQSLRVSYTAEMAQVNPDCLINYSHHWPFFISLAGLPKVVHCVIHGYKITEISTQHWCYLSTQIPFIYQQDPHEALTT